MSQPSALRSWTAGAIATLCLAVLALGASPAFAVGIDDNCPAPDDDKNLIISDAAFIYGTAKSDHICGGPSANVIVGALLDDEIYAGGGDDIVIGGHGVDLLDGGSGNDWLRGGTNADTYVGGFNGAGTDTASFADMTPVNGVAGMNVNLAAGVAIAGAVNESGHVDDQLSQIDNVIGSAFDDTITAASGTVNQMSGAFGDDVLNGTGGNDGMWGDGGSDTCMNDGAPVACVDGQGTHRPSTAVALVENRPKDPGMVVLGAEGSVDDTLTVTRINETLRVTGGGRLSAGANCANANETTIDCSLARARYVVVWGDQGNDRLTAGDNLENGPGTVDMNGGSGNDILTGGSEGENLFTGEGGADRLYGNGDFDALISEGDQVGSGGDYLDGGASDDQLVTDNACAGHTLWGGEGSDIIGFARQTTVGGISAGVHAQLGEGAVSQQAWAINEVDQEVLGCARSSILGGGETLEGTNQNDVLSGNEAPNTIWARVGNDTVFGNGGNDTLEGQRGADVVHGGWGVDTITGGTENDTLWGDEGADSMYGQDGNDTLYGNEGNDTLNGAAGDDSLWGYAGIDTMYGGENWDDLHARDGQVDSVIDCGAGYDPGAERDPDDPAGVGCNDRIPTNTYLTPGLTLNGQPGYITVSGNVFRADDGTPASGTVRVEFEKLGGGSWSLNRTVDVTLNNGHYDLYNWQVGVGQWRVRATFLEGQWRYARSESGSHGFQIKSGYRLVNRHSGKCLSLSANQAANGTAIIQWDCSGAPSPADGQVFTLVPMDTTGQYFNLKINSTQKCVDVTGVSTADGAYLQEWDCLGGGQTNQHWDIVPIAGQPPYEALIARHSGKCMDVLGLATGNGARVGQWGCWWGGNQQWSWQAIE
jgi:Ca2+-binding RTX toxin-like protein